MSIQSIIAPALPDSACFKPGLQAIKGSERNKFSFANTSSLNGSVDIDTCLKPQYPQSNRWDYVIGYGGQAYFVEVHPASTSEVNTMINKLHWVRNWISQNAAGLEGITKGFYWLATGKVAISANSPQARKLAGSGIKGPTSRFSI